MACSLGHSLFYLVLQEMACPFGHFSLLMFLCEVTRAFRFDFSLLLSFLLKVAGSLDVLEAEI